MILKNVIKKLKTEEAVGNSIIKIKVEVKANTNIFLLLNLKHKKEIN